MTLNVSELGINIIRFISNLYFGVFLQIGGLVSIPCILEKDCNGNPISTLDKKVNQRPNTVCLEQQIYASPENFTPTLLVMLDTFRRSFPS